MIIRVNDENGNRISDCELVQHDIGIWFVRNKSNIKNIYEDITQTEDGFTDLIDIDIENMISSEQLDVIKSITWKWSEFETLREEYELSTSDDMKYVLELIAIPKIYHYIDEDEYNDILVNVYDFFGYDGKYCNSSEYTYEELDEFIQKLNSIYEK